MSYGTFGSYFLSVYINKNVKWISLIVNRCEENLNVFLLSLEGCKTIERTKELIEMVEWSSAKKEKKKKTKCVYENWYRFSILHGWSNLIFLGFVLFKLFWNNRPTMYLAVFFCNFLTINLSVKTCQMVTANEWNDTYGTNTTPTIINNVESTSSAKKKNQSFSWFYISKLQIIQFYRICIYI